MTNLTSAINVQVSTKDKKLDILLPKNDDLLKYYTKEELDATADELRYIEKNINEYRKNNNWEDLRKEIL